MSWPIKTGDMVVYIGDTCADGPFGLRAGKMYKVNHVYTAHFGVSRGTTMYASIFDALTSTTVFPLVYMSDLCHLTEYIEGERP